MRHAAGIVFLFAWLLPASARADGPLPPNRGDPIRTSDYSVDLFQGPVLSTSRITALAGAYTALAEGAEGIPFNPAAASLRMPYSTTHVDWDISGGVTFPGRIARSDFDNNGDSGFQAQRDFFFGTLGGYIQHGHLSIGAMVSLQSYGVGQSPLLRIVPGPSGEGGPERATDTVTIRFFKVDPVVSYGFFDGQLHIGGGLRGVYMQFAGQLADARSETDLFTNYTVGVQGGVLWAPYAHPIRIGGAVRSPLAATGGQFGGGFAADARGDIRAGDFYLPRRAELPWEAEAGFALQLWKRPLNARWHDEDKVTPADSQRWRRTKDNGVLEPAHLGARRMLRERYRALPREKVLLTTSALVSGPVANAVGIESMLGGRLERSGERAVVTLRAGVESEIVPYWLVLRAGSYLEPSRFRHSSSRLHATGGFQVRLFESSAFGIVPEGTIWRLSTAIDVARDYFAWSAGAGFFL